MDIWSIDEPDTHKTQCWLQNQGKAANLEQPPNFQNLVSNQNSSDDPDSLLSLNWLALGDLK